MAQCSVAQLHYRCLLTTVAHLRAETPLQPLAASRSYFPQLDGVRAIAVAMVMIFHVSRPDLRVPGPIVIGQTGVDLFFVLSGFLITGILLKSPQEDWHEVRTFYTRRVLRIFPLYYFALIVVFPLFLHRHASWDLWLYLTNIRITWQGAGKLSGPLHFWSLAVEEQFYLVWPFIVLFLPRRHLGKVLAGMFMLAIASRIVLLHFGLEVFYFTLCRLDVLAAGAGLAVLQYRGKLQQLRRASLYVLIVSMLVVGAEAKFFPTGSWWLQVTKYSALAVMYASSIAWILTAQSYVLRKVLGTAPLRFIGRISYGLYVFHPMVFTWVLDHYAHGPALLRAGAAFAASFACALLSWYGMERYFIGLKDKVAPERAHFPAAAPAMTAL